MKLIKTFFIGAAALTLSACAMGGGAKGTKVSEEKFAAEAAKVEDHQYSKATVKYSIVEKHKNDGEKDVTEKGTLKFSFSNGSWGLDAGQSMPEAIREYDEYLGLRISYAMSMIPSGQGYTINYYTNPLGMYAKMSQKQSESGVSYSVSASAYMGFDKYGYLVEATSTYDYSYKVSAGGVSASQSANEKNEVTISYQ